MAKENHHSQRHYHSKRHHGYAMRENEQYATHEQTKRMMKHDGSMISEDHNAPCLLPLNVISRDWPRAEHYNLGYTDTLFEGAQHQMKQDSSDMAREFKPKKY